MARIFVSFEKALDSHTSVSKSLGLDELAPEIANAARDAIKRSICCRYEARVVKTLMKYAVDVQRDASLKVFRDEFIKEKAAGQPVDFELMFQPVLWAELQRIMALPGR